MSEGKLVSAGFQNYGFWTAGSERMQFYQCVDCETEYPKMCDYESGQENIMCNGHAITLCPWCRPDTAPWTAGRGI